MIDNLFLSFGAKSETGNAKEYNTDALIDFKILDGHVFAVCDGHDGAEGHGALAAKLVVESIKKYFYNRSYKDMAKALTNAVVYANIALHEQSKKDAKYQGIASTLAILINRGNKIYYAYAGDSRIYLLRQGNLQLLTRDHVVHPEDPAGEEVNIMLGRNKDIKFGVCKNPLDTQEHDVFLLTTDGVTDVISKDAIQDILQDENTAPEHKSLHLAELIKEAQGSDCYTFQIIEFSKPATTVPSRSKGNKKPLVIGIATVLISILVVVAAFVLLPKLKNKSGDVFAGKQKVEQSTNPIPEKEKSEPTKVEKQKPMTEAATKPEGKPEVKSQNKLASEKEAKQTTVGPVYYEHLIQYGENLYRLGLRYHVSQQKLIDLNGSVAKNMIAGQHLRVPVVAIHTVKNGESLSTLSDKYNVKIKLIQAANKMEPNQPLSVGKKVIIPLP